MWLYQSQLFFLCQEGLISVGVLPMVCVHECLVPAQIKGIGTSCLVTPSSHQGGGSQPYLLGRDVFFLICQQYFSELSKGISHSNIMHFHQHHMRVGDWWDWFFLWYTLTTAIARDHHSYHHHCLFILTFLTYGLVEIVKLSFCDKVSKQ